MRARPREDWFAENERLAGGALRVLGLAYREISAPDALSEASEQLVFVGLVAMQDALREEARSAIARCRGAGIRTIILDDDFATVVGAVEQGRIIYANIVRFVHYLLSCNLAEILTVFLAIAFDWPLPLVAMQILWLNLVTDVFPALALALEPASPGVMEPPPRDPKEAIVPLRLAVVVGWQGLLLTAVALVSFAIGLHSHGNEEGSRAASTMVFMTLALAQTFHTFNARSQERSIFGPGLFSNPWLWAAVLMSIALQVAAVSVPALQRLLATAPPAPFDWMVIAICSLVPIVVVEVTKLVTRMTTRGGSARPRRVATLRVGPTPIPERLGGTSDARKHP